MPGPAAGASPARPRGLRMTRTILPTGKNVDYTARAGASGRCRGRRASRPRRPR
ncbi:hypothetical protein BURMUCF2_0357, partial [Burkholderia multivorans CF2]